MTTNADHKIAKQKDNSQFEPERRVHCKFSNEILLSRQDILGLHTRSWLQSLNNENFKE